MNTKQRSSNQERRRVLVTGAAGNIGSYFSQHSKDKYDLRLMVHRREDFEKLQAYGEPVAAELSDLGRLTEICGGVDTVLHLAANPDPGATWEDLLEPNIRGVYHLFTAAKAAGCRRVIFASSIHAVCAYPPGVQVKTSEPVNPGDLYGVSKCFGEALGRYMAERENLSVIALRIGAFQPLEAMREESAIRFLEAFVSPRDLTQLIHRCIEVENIRFAIFHGISNNRFKRLDITDACAATGYEPVDDAFEEHLKFKQIHLREHPPEA